MSGPIVRKYGFPNFEKIFGEKPLLHGKGEESEGKKEPEKAEAQENAKENQSKSKG